MTKQKPEINIEKIELLPSEFKQKEESKEKSKHNIYCTWSDSMVYRAEQTQNWANGHSSFVEKLLPPSSESLASV